MMIMVRNILVGFLLIFILFVLIDGFRVNRMINERRKKRIIDIERYKKGLKPEMRDSILKR